MKRKIIFIISVISLILFLPCSVFAAEPGDTVIAGGMAFGLKFYTDGVLVCGVSQVDSEGENVSPGENAGIVKGDIITKIEGNNVSKVNDIINFTDNSNGKVLSLEILRGKETHRISIKPALSKSEGRYKLGLWIKDGTAGIGTVTYIEKSDDSFAGLGHGVCDIETGNILRLKSADVCDVTLTSVKSGKKGEPGELRGIITENVTGYLTNNTEHGVYGFFDQIPESDTTCVIAKNGEINEGDATILCTLDNNIISEYSIEIEKIYNNSEKNKNFVIRATDEKLISKTGGIVQGMSGSPIIQNGKLVGAVTHVLVDDPTRGYGIFIENML